MAARLEATAVNVGTSATQLLAASAHRTKVAIHNAGAADIFVGPSDVATTTGFPIPADSTFIYDAELGGQYGEDLYAIAAGAQTSPDNTRILAAYSL